MRTLMLITLSAPKGVRFGKSWLYTSINNHCSWLQLLKVEACVAGQFKHLELWIWRSGVQASPVALFP